MGLCRYLPTPSDRMGILWSLLAIEDSVIVEYGPAGTTHFSMSLFGELGVDQQNRLFTTHMSEDDVVMGDVTRLEDAIVELDRNYSPKVIFVIASAITAVLGGHVDAVTCSAAEAASNIASGELKVLAVANTERLEAYPDVPTFQEVGVDLTIVALRGLCVNKDPPDDVKKALCDGFEKVINSDACREKIEAANMTYMPLNAQETNDILDSMSGNFEKIINAYLNSAN